MYTSTVHALCMHLQPECVIQHPQVASYGSFLCVDSVCGRHKWRKKGLEKLHWGKINTQYKTVL